MSLADKATERIAVAVRAFTKRSASAGDARQSAIVRKAIAAVAANAGRVSRSFTRAFRFASKMPLPSVPSMHVVVTPNYGALSNENMSRVDDITVDIIAEFAK